MKKYLAAFVSVFLLTACAGGMMSPTPLATPNYSQYGITRLNVHEVQVVNDYVPPFRAPNVEHEFFLPPYTAVRDWARGRFQAVGNIGVAKVHILDASITKRDISIKEGAEGWFYNQVNAEYNLRIKARLEITSPNYENLPFAEVNVTRSLQTTEGTTLVERDRAMHEMVLGALGELDSQMTRAVQNNLGSVVR